MTLSAFFSGQLRVFFFISLVICDGCSLKNGVVNKVFSLSAEKKYYQNSFSVHNLIRVTFHRFNVYLRMHWPPRIKN